ncbi:RHS repeat-associated core domain-containing protein, partial [Limisphaera ngatamarikiensis]|uniref:RHS repeat-associated core domain-containing protein n=1 Tax=Limisphaera ngatamarikiensis TaxID=1324935 RepID=UPI00197E4983
TYDGNGNVWTLVSASTGTETARYEYGPFGEPLRLTGAAAASNPFRFSTKRTEDGTGLLLYEYRAYSPALGRWLSRDPIEEQGGANLFAFCVNQSVGATDDLGMQFAPPGWPWAGPGSPPFPRPDPRVEPPPNPPQLVIRGDCKDLVRNAVAHANGAMKKSKCKQWFIDRGARGEEYAVRCYGKCKLVCFFGGTAWTYAATRRIGVCEDNVSGLSEVGIASILIHEVAHHYCPVIGGEDCANSAMEACENALVGGE